MRRTRLLVFLLVLLLLSPIWMLGMIAYIVRLKLYNQPKGISGTAYEPFLTRAMAHGVGVSTATSPPTRES